MFEKRRLLKKKKRGLHEIQCDLNYLLTMKKADMAESAEFKARENLSKENKKEKPNPQAITQLSAHIANKEAIKNLYNNTLRMKEDLELYIESLEA